MPRKCWYCGNDLISNAGKLKDRSKTRDHVIPRSISPITFSVDSCWRCNKRKAALPLEDFRIKLLGGSSKLFAGEMRKIGNPSFLPNSRALRRSGLSPLSIYAAWFLTAAELSRRLDLSLQERYFRYVTI